ncbi:FRA10AC1 protein [Phytophthora cinnamomi]|uniref:FRA10AC1 protein n=1 Tax=Phytophthora cinnamomi TaxID=4785 RepID=UPI003559F9BE|nr:FRA10AC1 protein [Phytophthora cinnamomi]
MVDRHVVSSSVPAEEDEEEEEEADVDPDVEDVKSDAADEEEDDVAVLLVVVDEGPPLGIMVADSWVHAGCGAYLAAVDVRGRAQANVGIGADPDVLFVHCVLASSIPFASPFSRLMARTPPPRHGADSHASESMFQRHQALMRLYSVSTRRSNSVGSHTSSVSARNDGGISQTDLAVLRQQFQFIRDDEADAEKGETDWQVRMSVRYYQQLFREYALADLSRFKEGKIGLRWRTEMEVVAGKGQFSCGNKRCEERAGLHSYELLFAYVEHGERKRCLVKVRVCRACAEKLFYKKLMEVKKKQERRMERKRRQMEEKRGCGGKQKAKRRRRSVSSSESGSSSDSGEEAEEEDTQDAVSGENIHELCAKISAEQKAAYPADTSRADSRRADSSDERVFHELLP